MEERTEALIADLGVEGSEAALYEAQALAAARAWDQAVSSGRLHIVASQQRILNAALDAIKALRRPAEATDDALQVFLDSLKRPEIGTSWEAPFESKP